MLRFIRRARTAVTRPAHPGFTQYLRQPTPVRISSKERERVRKRDNGEMQSGREGGRRKRREEKFNKFNIRQRFKKSDLFV